MRGSSPYKCFALWYWALAFYVGVGFNESNRDRAWTCLGLLDSPRYTFTRSFFKIKISSSIYLKTHFKLKKLIKLYIFYKYVWTTYFEFFTSIVHTLSITFHLFCIIWKILYLKYISSLLTKFLNRTLLCSALEYLVSQGSSLTPLIFMWWWIPSLI